MEIKNGTTIPSPAAQSKAILSYSLPAADRDFLVSYLNRSALPHCDVLGLLSKLLALKPQEIKK